MIAYVDENGMITSTPPTEDIKKEEINPDEIIIATPKKGRRRLTILRGQVEFLMSQEDLALLKTFQVLRNTFSCKQCHWQYCRK